MIFHLLVVDDEERVLDGLVPSLVQDLKSRLLSDSAFARANELAGFPLPTSGQPNVKVSVAGYQSATLSHLEQSGPAHIHLHALCEKEGSFARALGLLKEHFVAVVVSDLRFSNDSRGARAGKYFVEDVQRRNPETFGILISAYQKPEDFPADRFLRKGAGANLSDKELVNKVIEGFSSYLNQPSIRQLSRELGRRGLVYQSDKFGSMLRRVVDYASLYFGAECSTDPGPRRPRPTLLLDGETGTGKTELAGLVHALSERREERFVKATGNQLTNETFLRSILFGHVRGAFTNAMADRTGLVQEAGKGILLLDDLHYLNKDCSVILHSFLDDGEYCKLGRDEQRMSSDSAIIVTVEGPRWEEIKKNQHLPESFVNRVEQLVVRVPPLRARVEDIEYQAHRYCQEFAMSIGKTMELMPSAVAWMVEYGFPGGNSRRLRDFVKGVVTTNARVNDMLGGSEMEEYAREIGLTFSSRPVRADVGSAIPGSSVSPPSTKPNTPATNVPELKERRLESLSPVPRGSNSPFDEMTGPEVPGAPGETDGMAEAALPENWPPEGCNRWQYRVARLAARALAKECKIPDAVAFIRCQRLFNHDLARYWLAFLAVARGSVPALDFKMVDELIRLYAVYREGDPVKAAKELGMKDNALREFIYSREQSRFTDTAPPEDR